jgi:hypothetical protein
MIANFWYETPCSLVNMYKSEKLAALFDQVDGTMVPWNLSIHQPDYTMSYSTHIFLHVIATGDTCLHDFHENPANILMDDSGSSNDARTVIVST